jgi:6-phosphogluconate dehydrogenase
MKVSRHICPRFGRPPNGRFDRERAHGFGRMAHHARVRPMQIAMVGLGRMGKNMVKRLLGKGHSCVVWDRDPALAGELRELGAVVAKDLPDLVALSSRPRAIWLMVPAAVTAELAEQIAALLEPGDILIDGGNSHYQADIDRAELLVKRGIHHVDVGTSGGVHGLARGYCLMVGGTVEAFNHLEPIFRALSPGVEGAERTPGRRGEVSMEEHGYLHCGPPGAGHFVKMIHNGIEYGLMAAYAEGFNILRHAGIGRQVREKDAETAPLATAKYYQFDFELDRVAELWRRGSVIPSWLLDLTAQALLQAPELEDFSGTVSDSGEGRWTQLAAIDEGVPAHVLSAAMFDRFESRGRAEFANKILSAMRLGFGGHLERR